MHPILLRIPESVPVLGGLAIGSFGFMLSMSFLVGATVLHRRLTARGYPSADVWDLAIYPIVAGAIGAKLYWVFSDVERLSRDARSTFFSGAGFTWYGGLIFGLLAFWLVSRRKSIPSAEALDGLGFTLPLSIAVGRIGCFLAGDDYGRPTGSFLGVAFPEGFPPTTVSILQERYGITVDPELIERFGQVVPVHPTQLYESALSLIVFAVVATRPGTARPGWLFALWLSLYGVQRFLVEILRLNPDVVLGLSTAQLLSVAATGIGVYYLRRLGGGSEGVRPRS